MADRFFVPDAANTGADFASTSRWSASNGGANGASVPGSADTAYIYAGNNVITSGSTHTVNTVVIGPGSSNVFGQAGSPLYVGGTTMNYAGQGSYAYFNGSWSGTCAIDDTGVGTVTIVGGTPATLNCGPTGTVVVQSGAGSPTTCRSAGARLVIGQSTSPITTLTVAGVCELGRPGASINVGSRGNLSFVATATGTVATTLTVYGGGSVDDRSVGDKATVEAQPGSIYNASNAKSGFTISTARVWAGASFNTAGKGVTIVVSSRDPIGTK